ncbi:cytochrome P450 family protein [Dictyobacter aurantiacus]|uniref:Cytochrome P450 n=1 Tax=Dictyobacter aurantiacus TaxID=1936993 RepID=A0A401ZLK9_9CHLR|nr:cytochrome P450 [Dictyobacter aurantiacus]GCE07704.1 cytochrome P450 [Dictyobacter aurantiacus]
MSQSTKLNLNSPIFKANPYPTFAQLRATDPVHLYASTAEHKTWLITRYKDADAILRDDRFVKERRNTLPPEERAPIPETPPSPADLMSLMMTDFDPPTHTRLRSLANLSFTPRMVEQRRERIQQITDELIDGVEAKGTMDIIEEFAFPLPMRVIAEMLGVPAEDSVQLHVWTKTIADALGDPVAFQQAGVQLQAFHTYLHDLIEKKRRNPADDLATRLIQAESEGEHLSKRELMTMIFLLIVAGHDTTASMIGNSMLALLTHPDQMNLLREDPSLIKSAVEEFLRYRSPFMQATFRWAREDIQIGGKQIRCGDGILVSLAAANHDDEAFVDAEHLDITRRENAHLAFGKGIHYCIGAPLARMEGQIAIGSLLRRFPAIKLSVDPATLTWRPGSIALGLNHLPVSF